MLRLCDYAGRDAKELSPGGRLVAQSVKCLPSAQVMVPGSRDQAPHWAPRSLGNPLLPLSAPPPACALSLSLKPDAFRGHCLSLLRLLYQNTTD